MKIIARYDLIFFFFFPICVLSTLLYLFAFKELALFAMGNWIFTLAVLLFVFFPKAKTKLGIKGSDNSDGKWIFSLFLSQLLMNLTVWSFAKIICIDLTQKELINIDLIHLSLGSGLFPWGFMILFSLTLGYFIYKKEALGLVSSVYKPFFKNNHLDSIGVAVDSYMRFIPFCVMIFILNLMSLAMILLIQHWTSYTLVTGLRFQVFFSSCILFLLISYPTWHKFLHYLMYQKVPTAFILFGFIVLLSLIYPLLNIIANRLLSMIPALDRPLIETDFAFKSYHILILITFWWYSLSAINGAYIAYISQNKTIKQVILYSLLGFGSSLVIVSLLDKVSVDFPSLPLLMMIFCGLLISLIILNKRNITYFLRATLPTDVPIKVRSIFQLLKAMPLATVSFLCAYFGMGVYLWSYLIIVLGFLPAVMIIFISFVSWLKLAD